MSEVIYITKDGLKIIQEKISYLLKEKKEVSKEIDDCRNEDRNLAESSRFISLRERQGLIEKDLNDYQEKLNKSKVIEPKDILDKDKVRFSSTVFLEEINTGEKFSFKIVGEIESDAKNGKISYLSPFGKELIGQQKGDIVDFTHKKVLKELEIVKIEYK